MARPHPRRSAGALRPIAILAAGAAAAAACIAGGMAAGAALSAGAGAQREAVIYALCIALPLIAAALAAGALTHCAAFRAEPAGAWARAFGWGAVGCGGVALAAWLGGMMGGIVPAGRGVEQALLAGTALCLLQAGGEEIFLRGWLQPVLARDWPQRVAIVAAALVFAALHMLGGERAPLSLVNLTLGGLAFGVLAARTGGLAAPVALHAGWNWGEQLLLGLDPNPGIGPFGALLDLDLTGSAIWGGSAEGLNASLAMTMALGVVLAITLRGAWMPHGGDAVSTRSLAPPR